MSWPEFFERTMFEYLCVFHKGVCLRVRKQSRVEREELGLSCETLCVRWCIAD